MGSVKESNDSVSKTNAALGKHSDAGKGLHPKVFNSAASSSINANSSLPPSKVDPQCMPAKLAKLSSTQSSASVQNFNKFVGSQSLLAANVESVKKDFVAEAKAAAEAEAMGSSTRLEIPISLAAIFSPPPQKPPPGSAYVTKPLTGSLAQLVSSTASEYASAVSKDDVKLSASSSTLGGVSSAPNFARLNSKVPSSSCFNKSIETIKPVGEFEPTQKLKTQAQIKQSAESNAGALSAGAFNGNAKGSSGELRDRPIAQSVTAPPRFPQPASKLAGKDIELAIAPAPSVAPPNVQPPLKLSVQVPLESKNLKHSIKASDRISPPPSATKPKLSASQNSLIRLSQLSLNDSRSPKDAKSVKDVEQPSRSPGSSSNSGARVTQRQVAAVIVSSSQSTDFQAVINDAKLGSYASDGSSGVESLMQVKMPPSPANIPHESVVIKPFSRADANNPLIVSGTGSSIQKFAQQSTVDHYQSGDVSNPLYSAKSAGYSLAQIKLKPLNFTSQDQIASTATIAAASSQQPNKSTPAQIVSSSLPNAVTTFLDSQSSPPNLNAINQCPLNDAQNTSSSLVSNFADCKTEEQSDSINQQLNASLNVEGDSNTASVQKSSSPALTAAESEQLVDASVAKTETFSQVASVPIAEFRHSEVKDYKLEAKRAGSEAERNLDPSPTVSQSTYELSDGTKLLGGQLAAMVPQNYHSPVTLSRIPENNNVSKLKGSQFVDAEEISDAHLWDSIVQNRRVLQNLKKNISSGSKSNFTMRTAITSVECRIALLLSNRIQLERFAHEGFSRSEHSKKNVQSFSKFKNALFGEANVSPSSASCASLYPDVKKSNAYGVMLYILQTEPQHVANLVKMASLNDIDSLLQTVMFTLFGNQYDSREEYLLLSIFQSVLSAHFQNATAFTELLRANTPISRLLTTYIRRTPGQQYLKSVLSGRIYHLANYENEDLEIQPVKIYKKIYDAAEALGVAGNMNPNPTNEEALQHPKVQSIYEKRAKHLMRIATHFLTIIIDSARMVPYGIRWICKQIRSLTKRHYPKSTEASICSLIGGFFLLRFINPAVVSPNAHNLIDFQIGKDPKRTLTLVAKMLQNLANRPSYNKEEYMQVLSPFISANKDRLNRFFLELCEVGDFYESLEIHQYIALSRGPSSVLISLSELYNAQSLVERHLDLLVPDKTHPLREAMSQMGPVPTTQLARSEDRTVVIPLCRRWETLPIQMVPSCLALGQQQIESDVLYMDTKALLIQLLRAMPLYLEAVREAKLDVKRIDLHRPESTPTLTPQAIREAIAAAQDMGVAPEESGVGRNINTMILNKLPSSEGKLLDCEKLANSGGNQSILGAVAEAGGTINAGAFVPVEALSKDVNGELATSAKSVPALSEASEGQATASHSQRYRSKSEASSNRLVVNQNRDLDESHKRVVGRSDSQIFHFDVDLHRVLELASQSNDPEVVLNGERAKRKLDRLKELGTINEEDGYKVLVDELSNDLNHLGWLHSQLLGEIDLLQNALQSVQSHNIFLKRQLETFNTYLKNVRIQAAYPSYDTLTLLRKMNKLSAVVLKEHNKYDRKFSFKYFEKIGVVYVDNLQTSLLAKMRSSVYFILKFVGTEGVHICLHLKKREKMAYEFKLELDDLLEKHADGQNTIPLGFLEVNIQPLVLLVSQFFQK